MRSLPFIIAVAAATVCTAFAVSSFASRDPFFEANVEALTEIEEGTPVQRCYMRSMDFETDDSYGIFCDERTTDNMLYPCAYERLDRKGVSIFCTKKNQ